MTMHYDDDLVPAKPLHDLAGGLDGWPSVDAMPSDVRMQVARALMAYVVWITPEHERGNIVALSFRGDTVAGERVDTMKDVWRAH